VPEDTYPQQAGDSAAAAELAGLIGRDYAGRMVAAGAAALEAELHPDDDPRSAAAAVLLAALHDTTRAEIAGGLLEGAELAVRDAELATLADTLRVAYRAAKSTPHNPLEGLLRLADAAGVDLDGPAPAPAAARRGPDAQLEHLATVIADARLSGVNAGAYTLARMILAAGYSRTGEHDARVLEHDSPDGTAYRFVAPGVLLTGEADARVEGDRWHVEQLVDGHPVVAHGEDEIAALLALVAARLGVTATFTPAPAPAAQ
jgi:hypothetical protein